MAGGITDVSAHFFFFANSPLPGFLPLKELCGLKGQAESVGRRHIADICPAILAPAAKLVPDNRGQRLAVYTDIYKPDRLFRRSAARPGNARNGNPDIRPG